MVMVVMMIVTDGGGCDDDGNRWWLSFGNDLFFEIPLILMRFLSSLSH